MTDIARLAVVVESQQAEIAEDRLDGLAHAADRAEEQVTGLSAAARGTAGPLQGMNAAIVQQQQSLALSQRAMGLTTAEGLNMSRQFTDIGVQMAMGMNPFMIAIQQGPQILDIFQMAAIRTGTTVRAAMVATGAAVWAALAPLLPIIAAIGAAVGVVAGAFGLLNREISKGYPDDITKGLGLTAEQLERVESRSVTFGDTVMATFTVIGRHIMDGPIGEALEWLGDKASEAFDFATKVAIDAMATIVGVVVGSYKTVTQNWRQFPAVIGDAAITAANAVIRAIEWMLARTREGINAAIIAARAIGQINPAFAVAQHIPLLGAAPDLAEISNPFAGAGAAMGRAWGANVEVEIENARAGIMSLLDEIGDEALRRATARALEEAGDPNKTRGGGRSEREREIEQIVRYIQALKDEAATLGMSAIAAKAYEIDQRALAAARHGLEQKVRAAGAALLDQMRIEAADIRGKTDEMEMLRLEARLIGAGNVERAVQIAQLRERQRLTRAGVDPNSEIGARAIGEAGDLARQAEENRIAQDRYNDSLRLTLDLARQIDDHAREMARGLADAFGAPGRALGDLLTTMTGYQARMEEIAEREREMRERGTLSTARMAELERDRAQAQVQNYGDMAAAARGFFEEGSTGYRVLLAIEQLYRAQQLAGMLMAMATGQQETASSVAGSMTRGAANMAEGASKMFASLGPWAFPAVAAMVAVLAGFGLRGGAGGGSRSLSSANDNTPGGTTTTDLQTASSGIRAQQEAARRQEPVRVVVTADRDGLNAYVVGTADRIATQRTAQAAPVVARVTQAKTESAMARRQAYTVRD